MTYSEKKNYQLSFSNEFELYLMNYIKSRLDEEIFIGLIGKIIGRKTGILEFKVMHGIPFPKLSEKKNSEVIAPANWLEIIQEYLTFYDKRFARMRPIGVLHSHPGSIPALSSIDQEFGFYYSSKLGNAIMAIVGKNFTLFSYLIEGDTFYKIKHKSLKFLKRYSFK